MAERTHRVVQVALASIALLLVLAAGSSVLAAAGVAATAHVYDAPALERADTHEALPAEGGFSEALVGGDAAQARAVATNRAATTPASSFGTPRAAGLADDATIGIGNKISGQMSGRGWTSDLIGDTLRNPSRTVVTRDTRWTSVGTRMDDAATAYIRSDGTYIVRNDVTGDIVQISNRNDPNWAAPWD